MTTRNSKENSKQFISVFTLATMILGAAFSRLIPHPWNFTAIGAMALFGGAYLTRKQSLIVPLMALFLSDLVLGFHSTMLFVYLPFVLTVILGWTLKDKRKPQHLGALSLVTSSIFFLISNFGVWMEGGFYSSSFQGLLDCYVAAIPFFDNQVFGDLFFTGVLFGTYEVLKKMSPEFFGLSSKVH